MCCRKITTYSNQNRHINNDIKSGEISRRQAVPFRTENRQICCRERATARQADGHITNLYQRVLSQQGNSVSTQVGKYGDAYPTRWVRIERVCVTRRKPLVSMFNRCSSSATFLWKGHRLSVRLYSCPVHGHHSCALRKFQHCRLYQLQALVFRHV